MDVRKCVKLDLFQSNDSKFVFAWPLPILSDLISIAVFQFLTGFDFILPPWRLSLGLLRTSLFLQVVQVDYHYHDKWFLCIKKEKSRLGKGLEFIQIPESSCSSYPGW